MAGIHLENDCPNLFLIKHNKDINSRYSYEALKPIKSPDIKNLFRILALISCGSFLLSCAAASLFQVLAGWRRAT